MDLLSNRSNDDDGFSEAFDSLIKQLQAMSKRTDLFDAAAQAVRASYEALIRAGFTETQAMEIVSRQGNGMKS